MPEALSSKALIKVNPSDGLILDLVNPSKTQWEKAQIEWNGQTVPLKINVGVFTFRINPNLGIFLGANTGVSGNYLARALSALRLFLADGAPTVHYYASNGMREFEIFEKLLASVTHFLSDPGLLVGPIYVSGCE